MTRIAKIGTTAATTAFHGEPARRPPTYPAIMGPAGWIHQSRTDRIKMIREEDQKENAGPSEWKRPSSLSTSIRNTFGRSGVWARFRGLRLGSSSSHDRAFALRNGHRTIQKANRKSQRSTPIPIP